MVNAIIDQLNEPDPAWWDQTDRLDVPTLIIGGGPDSPIPQELLTEVAARMPDATMITISAGHHVRASQPAAFLTAVSQFLANPATG